MNGLKRFQTVVSMLKTLSADYIERLALMLSEGEFSSQNLNTLAEEERYTDGRICPHCNSKHIVRNGHRQIDKVQRYLCRDCCQTFIANTNSITSGTRKDTKIWKKYIECLMNGISIRKSADICGIHRNTAFAWRHKILDTLQKMMTDVELDGIVEADETFLPVSYKGNHKKSKTFEMPRPAHHRGHSIKKKGLSDEQVCIPCAVNRKGKSVAKVGKLGKVNTLCIENIVGKQIKNSSILCTDKEQAYRQFSKLHNLKLIQLDTGKSKQGIYHIQHINSYHSNLKVFLYKFKGVSTKYLNNYLVWYNFVEYADETYKEKMKILLEHILKTGIRIRNIDIPDRPPLPLVV